VFERILVPLDGSERAERALPLAMHVSEWFGAELTLFHVLSPLRSTRTGVGPTSTRPGGPADIPYPDELHDRGLSLGSAYLDEVVTRLRDHGVAARTGIVSGDAADMIVARAEAGRFSMIAMTTTTLPPFLRLFRWGTLRGVWREATVPLLILDDGTRQADSARATVPEGLVVPLDGSRAAEWALVYARRMAQGAGLPVMLLRSVFRPPFARLNGSVPGTGASPDAERYLAEKADELRSHGIETTTALDYRDPSRAIVAAQDRDFSRMVVMASRMRRGWRRSLLGSRADEVVRLSRGAVMVIPAGRTRRAGEPVEDDPGASAGPGIPRTESNRNNRP